MYLNPEQIEQLLKPINPRRVSKDGKGFSHVEAYDVRAHLTRILGFARWSAEVSEMALVFETVGAPDDPNAKARGKWTVAYRARCTLTVCAPDGTGLAVYSEYAVGDTTNQPSRADAHDLAVKTAESQALKRCATNLGDQFALSLYNGGSLQAIVSRTLVMGEQPTGDPGEDVDANVPDINPEGASAPTVGRETSSPRPSQAPAQTPAPVESNSDPDDLPAEEDPELAAAEAVIKAVMEETVPDTQSEAVAEVAALVMASREQGPEEAMTMLKEALELAVARGIRQHRLPNGATIGAELTKMLGERSAEMGEG